MFSFRRKKVDQIAAHWGVYNAFELYEFAECSNCGHEVNGPENIIIPFEGFYPKTCPNCQAKMIRCEIVS